MGERSIAQSIVHNVEQYVSIQHGNAVCAAMVRLMLNQLGFPFASSPSTLTSEISEHAAMQGAVAGSSSPNLQATLQQ
jgi:hypothetical protein